MCDLAEIINKLAGRASGVLANTDDMKAAVILPLVYHNDELSVLFEVRAQHLKRQPGEICFPGGRIDATDPTPQLAAVRELTEELGVEKDQVEMVAPLDVLVTPFRGVIYPFVAHLKTLNLQVNHEEVDHVFTVPLSYLYNYSPKTYKMGIHFEPDKDFPLHQISNREAYEKRINYITEYFYHYDSYVIWGITARILKHFISFTKKESTI